MYYKDNADTMPHFEISRKLFNAYMVAIADEYRPKFESDLCKNGEVKIEGVRVSVKEDLTELEEFKQKVQKKMDDLINYYIEKGWKGRKNAIIKLKKDLGFK